MCAAHVTREQLVERLRDVKMSLGQHQQALQNEQALVQTYHGAVQMLEQLIASLPTPEEPE